MRRAAAIALAVVLSACALGPDYKPPALPAGATAPLVAANAPATSTSNAPDEWWKLYNDPVLDGLIAQAFAANADLQVAEANLAASRAIYEGAQSQLLPQTDTGAGAEYGRNATTNEILELGGHKPVTGWQFDALIDASYELDLFGHVRRSIEAARDNTEAVAAARDDLRITIAAETARAYGQICTLGEQINVANQALALANQQQQIVQGRLDAGAGSHFDVVRTQVVVAQSRAALPPLQGEREAAVYELAALLGETPQNGPQNVQACVTPPRLAAPVPVGDGAALLQRRPDIREADRQLAVALANVGVAKSNLFPRVTLGGFWGGATSQINMLGSNNALTWGVGPAISWSFPNLAGPLAQLAQTHANAAGALAHYDSVVLQALKDTQQSLAIYSAELAHHDDLAAAQSEAQQEYGLAKNEFSAGNISTLDLLAAEQTVTGANAAVAVSDADLVRDQISLFKSLGGGWQQTQAASQPVNSRQ